MPQVRYGRELVSVGLAWTAFYMFHVEHAIRIFTVRITTDVIPLDC